MWVLKELLGAKIFLYGGNCLWRTELTEENRIQAVAEKKAQVTE
jgi:hypothetical protein